MRQRVESNGYFENRKLSVKDLDRHFGTVKHSVCSQKMPSNSIVRATTALDENQSEIGDQAIVDLNVYKLDKKSNASSDHHHAPLHPRAVAKAKVNLKFIESYQRQKQKALEVLAMAKQKRRPTNSKVGRKQ